MTMHYQPGYRNMVKKPSQDKLHEVENEIKAIFPECQVVMYEYTFVRLHTYRLFVDMDEITLQNKCYKVRQIEQIIEKHFPKNDVEPKTDCAVFSAKMAT